MSRADNSFAFAFNKIAPPENNSPEALRAYNSKVNRAFEEIYEKVMGHLDEKNLSPKTRKELDNKVESKELDKYTLLTQTDEKIALEASRVDGHLADFTVRADGIDAAVQTADGKAAQAQLTANGASTTASNAEGKAAQALQTAEAFSWRLKDRYSNHEVRVQEYSGGPALVFTPNGADNNDAIVYADSEGLHIASRTNLLHLYGDIGVDVFGDFLPKVPGSFDIGSTSARFYQGFWTVAANVSSDIRIKRDVAPLDALALLDRLIPFRYRLKEDPRKLHFGFIAQSVQDSLRGTGLEDAALLADEDPGHLGLCYEELIAVLVEGYQKQQREIDQLRADMTAALNRITALEGGSR